LWLISVSFGAMTTSQATAGKASLHASASN